MKQRTILCSIFEQVFRVFKVCAESSDMVQNVVRDKER